MSEVRVDMSDIHEWLVEHSSKLAGLAEVAGVSGDLVTELAIFMLSGLSDEEIRAHLWPLELRFAVHRSPTAAGIDHALDALRSLAREGPRERILV